MVSQYTSDKLGKNIGDRVEFLDTEFTIVGVSIVDAKSEGRSYPLIMVDFSHLDRTMAYLEQVAES